MPTRAPAGILGRSRPPTVDPLDAYDFSLPEALVAQRPPARRDGARMLVVDRAAGTLADARFADLPAYVRPGDAVVFNDSRVIPARLVGHRAGGGAAEVLLVRRLEAGLWEALVRPGRRLRAGARVTAGGGRLTVDVVRDAVAEGGRTRAVRLGDAAGQPFPDDASEDVALDAAGQMPLPPYVARPADAADRARYQTVFARARGSVAAPTAGLHATPETLDALRAAGAAVAHVTLHVGYGTFEPVRAADLAEHRVAEEWAEVPAEAVEAVGAARRAGARVLAVGTTTARALETAAGADGAVRPFRGPTGLTVTPGYRFRAVDALLTNFHLPRSSLLVLVAAFGGRGLVLEAYRHAVEEGYRFYSYGDCMLVL